MDLSPSYSVDDENEGDVQSPLEDVDNDTTPNEVELEIEEEYLTQESPPQLGLRKSTRDRQPSKNVRDRKTTEFQTLTQGSKTVAEYDRDFTELARYAPHMVNNEYRKARKFESGLRGRIQDRVNMLNMPTYTRVLDKAILAEANLNKYQSSGENQRKRQDYDNRQAPSNVNKKVSVGNSSNSNQESGTRLTCTSCGMRHFGVCHQASGVCFECGEMGHHIKDCPKVKAKDGKKR
ncbi:uncharacterized protein LOC114262791 [Camellia sinensis]|uniref:uncharacterized protein LOC114262791 n=1 Tax=Camellia sinensis TaxID=4442 RepID=UPI001035B757|nr:uncharacterized protein LOC114262791 [Camellia sinensis]